MHCTAADEKPSQERADVDHSSTQCLSGFFVSGFFAAGRSVHLTSRAEDEGSAPADLRRHLMVEAIVEPLLKIRPWRVPAVSGSVQRDPEV
jgi:hypothetical protein